VFNGIKVPKEGESRSKMMKGKAVLLLPEQQNVCRETDYKELIKTLIA
jgi:hypothetical protein